MYRFRKRCDFALYRKEIVKSTVVETYYRRSGTLGIAQLFAVCGVAKYQ